MAIYLTFNVYNSVWIFIKEYAGKIMAMTNIIEEENEIKKLRH